MKRPTIYPGDCLDVLAELPAASVDAVVTDPPYGLGFMGKGWDELPPGVEWAAECLRVLKPGGHLLAFGGTRTWHRLMCAVEDAGFEIRDSIAWLYGSGFPKSLDVSKAIDKAGGAAVQWAGWGTSLKPAFEPIVVARKPLQGTVAANVQEYGTGGLNIDGCRIGTDSTRRPLGKPLNGGAYGSDRDARESLATVGGSDSGRWPANVILDEDQAAALDEQSGFSTPPPVGSVANKAPRVGQVATGDEAARISPNGHGDAGGASRFFYCAKAGRRERPVVNGVAHPTVKPLALMRYLVRLVTPPGGVVLDPFAGSGATIEAAILEGFDSIGIERESSYLPHIQARIDRTTEVPE
jgi:hypothetical protein